MLRLLASAVSAASLALVLAASLLGSGTAAAQSEPGTPRDGKVRLAVPTPPERFTPPDAAGSTRSRAAASAQISGTIYLERCRGGCVVTYGANDARAMSSSIPQSPGSHTISEYRNGAGKTGAEADAEWTELVRCMREVYLPFNVTVTDTKPVDGSYHLAIIAGFPQEIAYGPDVLGVAPLATDCSPQDNVISFSFANAHPQTELRSRVQNLCWTAAQESAHAFGLDHEYAFLPDNRSTCNDPMTYRVDCGGQKFFRDAPASCGEFRSRACRCGASQNSHGKLISVFGAGSSPMLPPTAVITEPLSPAPTAPLPAMVKANAGSPRGVARIELLVNGYPWAEVKGRPFGPDGQDNPGAYELEVPPGVPSSIIDLEVRAYDDLGTYADSPVVTVTKGGPCETADTCAKGQRCEQGRCFWDPPAGQLGDACEYPQFCVSGLCRGTQERLICTEACVPGVEDACPEGFVCEPTGQSQGICFFPRDGGCCSTSRDGRVPWPAFALAAMTLGLLARPWRRRAR